MAFLPAHLFDPSSRELSSNRVTTMIPECWLKERLECVELQDLYKREMIRSGVSDRSLADLLANGPSPVWVKKWIKFIERRMPGDELWVFESPSETWEDMSGTAGYALVRSGQIVDSIISRRS